MNQTDDRVFDESMSGPSEPSESRERLGIASRFVGAGSLNDPVVDELTELGFQRLSGVGPVGLEWVWDGYLPRGKLACLFGEPGVGKSLVALQVAAMVTRGWVSPSEGAPVATQTPGGVVLLSSFDEGSAETVRSLAEQAGADLHRMFLVREDRLPPSTDASDQAVEGTKRTSPRETAVDRLRRSVRRIEATLGRLQRDGVPLKLIVIDSIDHYVSSVSQAVLNEVIEELVELAERSRATVLVVGNVPSLSLAGAGTANSRWRVDAFTQAARAVLMVAQDPDRDQRRIVLPVKMNFSGRQPGWVFTVEQGVVRWRSQPVPISAHEFFRQVRMRAKYRFPREETGQLRRAMRWLRKSLSNGPISSMWLQYDASLNEISYATLRRAYARLGCRSFRKRGTTRWFWRLPEEALVLRSDPVTPPKMTPRSDEIDGSDPVVQGGLSDEPGQVAQVVHEIET